MVVPGDVLNLDVTGLGVPTLLEGPGANNGVFSFAAAASVTYTSIETVNGGGGVVNLVIDMQFAGFQNGVADEIFVRLNAAGTELLIDVNGAPIFQGADATINSLTVIGSSDNDTLRIDETAGGLPKFLGQTPAVNNTGVGGGTANPSHLNASADLILETLFPAGTPWDASDVTIHFNGRSGDDRVSLNLITFHQTVYTSDTLDGANSGNLGTAPGLALPDFAMSFANLAPLNLTGAGGPLVVDATSTPATANLFVRDALLNGDGWSQVAGDGGFEQTFFRDYTQLFVVGGDGGEFIDMEDLDTATTLTSVTLQGGNTADLLGLLVGNDISSDTIQVESTPATTPVVVDADGGDDTVLLFDKDVFTVDNILANVNVDGGTGNNLLQVVDSGDLTGDNVTITQLTIEGLTGFAGTPDVNYANIDTLDVTGTAGNDIFDTLLNAGSDLDIVRVNGNAGNDQFYLDLNTGDNATNIVAGLVSVTMSGDAGSDVFGQTPDNAPHAITGLPPLPAPPAPLPPPIFSPPLPFPGVNRGKIRPSISTIININGGLDQLGHRHRPGAQRLGRQRVRPAVRPPEPGPDRPPPAGPVEQHRGDRQHGRRPGHAERSRSGRILRGHQLQAPPRRSTSATRVCSPAWGWATSISGPPRAPTSSSSPASPRPTSSACGSTRPSSTWPPRPRWSSMAAAATT